jgi:NAD+ kinase
MPTAFKTVALVGKSDAASLPDVVDQLVALLKRRGHSILMDPLTADAVRVAPDEIVALEDLPSRSNLAIVVGGDGTLLSCARLMAAHGVPLVGVNLGRLGFLTDIAAKDLLPSMQAVLDGEYTEEARMLLSGTARRGRDTLLSAVAMNDVVVSRGATGSMIEFAVTVDDEFIYTLRADGLIVATPTGSTAYALSAGGPILHPALSAIALVPISPHTLSNRPVAIRSNSRIDITLVRGPDARAQFDVQAFCQLEAGDVVTVTAAPRAVKLLHPKGYKYFSMLREKLRWNERTT